MSITIKGNKSPPCNSPCPCGSNLKFKYCHGDPGKQAVCNRVANEKMVQLIREEQKRKGMIPKGYKCVCGHSFDNPDILAIMPGREICPECQSLEIEKIGEG